MGIALAVALGSIALHWPNIIAGAPFLAWAMVAMVVVPENGFKPAVRNATELGTFVRSIHVVRG